MSDLAGDVQEPGNQVRDIISTMSNYRPPKPGSTEQTTVYRPAKDIHAEEEAERLRIHLDLEAGRITPEELRKQNGIDCSAGIYFTPFHELPESYRDTDFDLEAWQKDPIPIILKNAGLDINAGRSGTRRKRV